MDKPFSYDEERAHKEDLTELLFNYNEDGTYTKRVGYNYLPEGDMLYYDVWKMFDERFESAKKMVQNGEKSPVWYHMEKNLLDLSNFSKIVGIASWRIKRHLKPKVFSKLNRRIYKKYADALDISVEEFIHIK